MCVFVDELSEATDEAQGSVNSSTSALHRVQRFSLCVQPVTQEATEVKTQKRKKEKRDWRTFSPVQ